MLSLPQKFKFYHEQGSTLYNAEICEDHVLVYWTHLEGEYEKCSYSLEQAKNCVASGVWIIEKENNMQQTNIQQMEATVAELLAKAEELKQLIEKEKQKEDVWPNIDDVYCYIDNYGVIGDSRWDGDEYDTARMEIGNVFRTEYDAEKALTKRKIQTKLEHLAKNSWGGINVDWADYDTQKHYIAYDGEISKFLVQYAVITRFIGTVYFATEQAAKDAIKEIGEDNLKLLFM